MPNEIKINNTSFDVDYHKDHTEEQFIKEHLDSMPSNMGSETNRIAFLKEAYAKVMIAAKGDAKPQKPGK